MAAVDEPPNAEEVVPTAPEPKGEEVAGAADLSLASGPFRDDPKAPPLPANEEKPPPPPNPPEAFDDVAALANEADLLANPPNPPLDAAAVEAAGDIEL